MQVTGNGSVYEVRPGVYQYRFNLGRDPETGKYVYSPKRTLHCVTKNKRGREAELRTALEEYKRELETGIAAKKSTDKTVGEYADEFHSYRKGTMGSELSWKREGLDVRHIKELFGNIKLQRLKAPVIKETYAKAREEGTYSPSELHKIHAKLSQIMKEAVNDELIVKNPCDSISVPRPAEKERQALSAEEASRLLLLLNDEIETLSREGSTSALQAIPHLIGTLLLLDTGIRRGEMLGLDWDHVDFEKGTAFIAVQYANDKTLREPKSKKSKRKLHLGPGMLEQLKAWKASQAKYFAQIAKRQEGCTPVVNNEIGANLDPNNYNRWFRDWCVANGFGARSEEVETYRDANGKLRYRKKGYKGLTPHMLRHTQATLLIGANTDIKTVQHRLGHSTIDMTMNTYAHAIEANDAAAATTFSAIIGKQSEA